MTLRRMLQCNITHSRFPFGVQSTIQADWCATCVIGGEVGNSGGSQGREEKNIESPCVSHPRRKWQGARGKGQRGETGMKRWLMNR